MLNHRAYLPLNGPFLPLSSSLILSVKGDGVASCLSIKDCWRSSTHGLRTRKALAKGYSDEGPSSPNEMAGHRKEEIRMESREREKNLKERIS